MTVREWERDRLGRYLHTITLITHTPRHCARSQIKSKRKTKDKAPQDTQLNGHVEMHIHTYIHTYSYARILNDDDDAQMLRCSDAVKVFWYFGHVLAS